MRSSFKWRIDAEISFWCLGSKNIHRIENFGLQVSHKKSLKKKIKGLSCSIATFSTRLTQLWFMPWMVIYLFRPPPPHHSPFHLLLITIYILPAVCETFPIDLSFCVAFWGPSVTMSLSIVWRSNSRYDSIGSCDCILRFEIISNGWINHWCSM